MTSRRVHEGSLRPDRLEISRLLWALGISLAAHLLFYGGYQLGNKYNVWQALQLPKWVEKVRQLTALTEPRKQPAPREVPLMFVDVNPQLASIEPPKNAKFYSNKNSEAANPDTDQDSNDPKITGKQTDVMKAEDVNRSKLDRLQPNVPRAESEQQPEQARERTPKPEGDMAMAKPETEQRQDQGTAQHARPRTIKEAIARLNRNQLAGQKIKQDGGVKRRTEFTALDAKATQFGDYDAAFIDAVESRWFNLLANNPNANYRSGRVLLRFRLMFDGRITDMQVVENNVGETLGLFCQKAITDPAPFERWSREMRLMLDKDYREIQFAFYYY